MMIRLISFILLVSLIGCKSTHTSTTKTHSISDTIIYEYSRDIHLPVKNVTIIENPCKKDSLVPINQTVTSENSTLKITNVNGNLVIEQNIDSIVNSKLKEIIKHTEKQVEITEKTIIKYRTHKFWWYFLGIVLLYVAYRVARIYIPFLRFLPY